MKKETLKQVEAKLRARYGPLTIPTLKERRALDFIPRGISTQSLSTDLMLGRPGLPLGRAVQITGLDGHGKTTLVLHLIAEVQRIGGHASMTDAERCYEWGRARRLGVDREKVRLFNPDSLEAALKIARDYVRGFGRAKPNVPHLHVIDSLDGLPPLAVQELKPGERLPAAVSLANGLHLPDLINACAQYKCCLLFVSQLSHKMSARGLYQTFEQQFDTKGGLTPKFRASIRLHVRRGPKLPDGSGYVNVLQTIKNKVGVPFKKCEYNMLFRTGIDKYVDLFEAGKQIGVVKVQKAPKKGEARYRLQLGEGLTLFTPGSWRLIVAEHGGPDAFRDTLTEIAIQKGLMEPYGIPNEERIAESDGERDVIIDEAEGVEA